MKMDGSLNESSWHQTPANDSLQINPDLGCGEMTKDFSENWMKCQYWCEGIFFGIVGVFGVMGNIVSILILATR